MSQQRLLRFDDRPSLVSHTAGLLLQAINARQAASGAASLCLTGGTLANEVYDQLALTAGAAAVRTNTLHVWWNWDYFVATDNPQRNSLQTLARLGALTLDPAKIHPIPSSSVAADPQVGAAQYAQELTEAGPIDICLVELGTAGQIAGLFPQPRAKPSASLVIGVDNAPLAHTRLVTMTCAGLNACSEIWILASGAAVAAALRQAREPDPSLPTYHLTPRQSLLWLIDSPAAGLLPLHHCAL
jgi:6-phosphogluconolactonase